MTVRNSFIAFVFTLSVSTVMLPAPAHAQTGGNEKKNPQLKEIPAATAATRHAPGDTVGVINGVVITYSDFNSIMSGYLKTFVARTKNNVVTDSLYTVIVDSSWDRALTDIVLEEEIATRKLEMKDAEIKDSLLQHPPDFLQRQFSDSLGRFHPEYLRQALTDPRNDSIVHIILEGEKVRLETERLAASVAPKSSSSAERDKAFEAWLRRAKRAATIDDRRTRFGFY